ncbi:methionine adenosyltransferase [uncultured Tessaracoccus sp.]|uniref:methionine adenosyltransferase n=1 Tax=uncultured Tessaracoccus sp. TaxID=905023 RepID=UPI0025F4BEB4|nr:methionine adenosyltransferase [uncultured Tessaracoccus sp.]
MSRLFTSESVTEGHPDKIADSISDAILDALLEQDHRARVAVETLITTGLVVVAGEVTTTAYANIPDIVRQRITEIGYTSSRVGFDGASCGVTVALDAQSPDIAQGVDRAQDATDVDGFAAQGAGDQGLMFGYACNETESLMPLPIAIAHRLAERLAEVRHRGEIDYLRPDGKSQVGVRYGDDGRPQGVETVLVSTQHDAGVDRDRRIRPDLERLVIARVLESFGFGGAAPEVLVNPTGTFVIGGPMGDAGLTGRKIIVDTYGGMARHGGGAFSGKDPSKVDRSAAYALRWVAKNIVAAGLADKVEAQVAYAIGRAEPVGFTVDTFGTGRVPEERIEQAVLEVFDLRPAAIIHDLDLLRPVYADVSVYGHFGRDLPSATWERTDRADRLAEVVRG